MIHIHYLLLHHWVGNTIVYRQDNDFISQAEKILRHATLCSVARGHFNEKMPPYQFRNSHYKDKTVSWHLIFIMEIPIPRKIDFDTETGCPDCSVQGWDILMLHCWLSVQIIHLISGFSAQGIAMWQEVLEIHMLSSWSKHDRNPPDCYIVYPGLSPTFAAVPAHTSCDCGTVYSASGQAVLPQQCSANRHWGHHALAV